MSLLVIWHWHLSRILAISAVGLVLTIAILYLIIVRKPQYPKKQ